MFASKSDQAKEEEDESKIISHDDPSSKLMFAIPQTKNLGVICLSAKFSKTVCKSKKSFNFCRSTH